MKASTTEIPVDNLEDLLIYDDIFLEYFNSFLSLPTFPQLLEYHRLTGTFRILETNEESIVDCATPPYGATDEERETIMKWAQKERLPLFLKTELFRELKLCKQMLRPLEEREVGSRGTNIRGYSRQSGETTSMSSFSASASDATESAKNRVYVKDLDDDDEEDDDETETHSGLRRAYDFTDSDEVDLNKAPGARFKQDQRKYYQQQGQGQEMETDEGDGDLGDQIPYDQFTRPGSRAVSLPAQLGLAKSRCSSASSSKRLTAKNSTHSKRKQEMIQEVTFSSETDPNDGKLPPDQRQRSKVSFQFAQEDRSKYRISSAPLSYADYLRLPIFSEFDYTFGGAELYQDGGAGGPGGDPAMINFRGVAGKMNEPDQLSTNEVDEMEIRQNLTFQRLKEVLLGGRSGMREFLEFLSSTVGIYLVDFWMDCENYKDNIYSKTAQQSQDTRNRLFRDLQDKYKLRLTAEAKHQIRQAANDPDQANALFLRTQYDVLRRLRSYWLPRFILHRERELTSQTMADLQSVWLSDRQRKSSHVTAVTGIFPSLSLVNSMPCRAEEAVRAAREGGNWDQVRRSGRRDSKIHWNTAESVRSSSDWSSHAAAASPPDTPGHLLNKLRAAIAIDRIAGGPFQTFLEEHKESTLTQALLFFQEVEEYAHRQDRSGDRLLRLAHAWAIANKYISPGARCQIGVPSKLAGEILNILRKAHDRVPASVFAEAQEFCVNKLTSVWLRFLKEDVKKFVESSMNHRDTGSPPQTAEEFEVAIEGDRIVVRRVLPPKLTLDNVRQRTWDLLSDEEKAERRRQAAERRRITEIERRRAIKAAKKRLKDQALGKRQNSDDLPSEQDPHPVGVASAEQATRGLTKLDAMETMEEKDEGEEGAASAADDDAGAQEAREGAEVKEDKPPELKDMIQHRQVMSLFKHYLDDKVRDREIINQLALYQEAQPLITTSSAGGDQEAMNKRDTKATYIYKTFLDKNARRHVEIPEKFQQRIANDKERPRTPTLKDLINYYMGRLGDVFQTFWLHQAEEMGTDMKALLSVAQKERGDIATMDKYKKGKKTSYRSQPSKEDDIEFMVALNYTAFRPLTLQMLYFYKYLIKYGVEEGQPNIDKDLFFYVEVLKFKELCHGHADDALIRRKAQSISATFLESAFPPANQVTVSNDLCQRMVRSVQRLTPGREVNPNLFDEAQYQCYKDLLPYWASFLRDWMEPPDGIYRPESKYRKMLEHRQELYNKPASPKPNLRVPSLPRNVQVATLNFTLNDGLRWKQAEQPEAPPSSLGQETGISRRQGGGREFTGLTSIAEQHPAPGPSELPASVAPLF